MNLLAHRITYHFPDWNQRIITAEEIYDFCEANGARVIKTDLIEGLGEYRVHRDIYPVILINEYIKSTYYAWVLFHEAAHFLLHPISHAKFSDRNQMRKIEHEANLFAAVALIPQQLMMMKEAWEIEEVFGYPRQLIMLRKKIFDDYGI